MSNIGILSVKYRKEASVRVPASVLIAFMFMSICAGCGHFDASATVGMTSDAVSADSSLSSRVRRWHGNVWLPVPMVEQRIRGLCAPATIERVMAYYGIKISTSDLAGPVSVARTSGVNVQKLLEKVEDDPRSHCVVKEYLGFGTARFERTLGEYNAKARKQGKPAAEWNPLVLNLSEVFAGADSVLLHDVASRQPGKRKFLKDIQASVNAGVPLIWGVVLGVSPEKGVPAGIKGGHLRLIVGYSENTQEIIYSDTWGIGHERKKMSLDNAWAMTMTLHALLLK